MTPTAPSAMRNGSTTSRSLFADGTFGCTTTRDITVTCEWDADGGMRTGRNALPNEFNSSGDDANVSAFLKCTAS